MAVKPRKKADDSRLTELQNQAWQYVIERYPVDGTVVKTLVLCELIRKSPGCSPHILKTFRKQFRRAGLIEVCPNDEFSVIIHSSITPDVCSPQNIASKMMLGI